MRKIIYIFILFFLSSNLICQEKNIQKADNSFKKNDFVDAAKYYKRALRKSNDMEEKKSLSYSIALCFQQMNLFTESVNYYEDAIGKSSDNSFIYEGYGDALARSGQIEKALKAYNKAINIDNENIDLLNKIKRAKYSLDKIHSKSTIKIQKEKLLNSEFSDYGVAWFNDKLIFASTRLQNLNDKIDGRTSQAYSDLFISEFDKKAVKWLKPEKVRGVLNTKHNDGSFAFDKNENIGLTMQCNEKSSGCVLISAKYNAKGDFWIGKKLLNFNNKDYSFGHPTISENGEILYFVSNMPGGSGGKDIWKSNRKDDGEWGIPINLGEKINTVGDEMFPFIIGDTLLFFASDGHFGFGGLDIFYSAFQDFEFSDPVNIGKPFNSSSDDMNIIIKNDLSGGLFCSNRDVSQSDEIYSFDGFPLSLFVSGSTKEAGSNSVVGAVAVIFTDSNEKSDTIYSNKSGVFSYSNLIPYKQYKIKAVKQGYFDDLRTLNVSKMDEIYSPDKSKISLNFLLTRKNFAAIIQGKIIERATKKPVSGQMVLINGSNNFSSYTFTDINGNYVFVDIKPKASYIIKISKKDYFTESRECKIPDIRKKTTFSKKNGYDMDFLLTKIEKKKEIALNNIYYDFDKVSLRDESKIELNKLAAMLKETPNVFIQISSHTDDRGSDSYNQKLSDGRAKAVVDYLVYSGISAKRLISKGFGEQKLVIKDAKTDDEHQANRRTTFSVTSIIKKSKSSILATTSKAEKRVSFRIQLLITKVELDVNNYFKNVVKKLPGLKIFVTKSGDSFKYEAGQVFTLKKASVMKKSIKNIGFPDCFITSYYNGNKISISKAKELL